MWFDSGSVLEYRVETELSENMKSLMSFGGNYESVGEYYRSGI